METIVTLQHFMLHTKGVIYLIMIAALFGMLAFWGYLTGRDKEE
jgi:hypothetical protein